MFSNAIMVAEFWTIKVDHNNAKEYYCATVAGEKAQFMKNSKFVGNKCNYGFIGTDCQINCSAIATNVDICKNSIICAPNDHIPAGSDCFCPTTSRLCKPGWFKALTTFLNFSTQYLSTFRKQVETTAFTITNNNIQYDHNYSNYTNSKFCKFC